MKVYWESFGKGLLASEKQNNTQKRDCSCHSSGCYHFWVLHLGLLQPTEIEDSRMKE